MNYWSRENNYFHHEVSGWTTNYQIQQCFYSFISPTIHYIKTTFSVKVIKYELTHYLLIIHAKLYQQRVSLLNIFMYWNFELFTIKKTYILLLCACDMFIFILLWYLLLREGLENYGFIHILVWHNCLCVKCYIQGE